MPGPDIFISYSREDRAAARHFAECFGEEGFSVWWDAALHSGETFDEVIEAELKASKAVVVLWSPRSVTSRWVRAEATLADRRNKLAPVIIEPCDRPLIFELTHTADLSDWDGDTANVVWRSFIRDLRRMVGHGPARRGGTAEGQPAARFVDRIASGRMRPSMDRTADEASADRQRSEIRPPAINGEPALAAPTPEPEPEPERTQFYTRSDGLDLLGDQFHCLEIRDGNTLQHRYVVSPLGVKIGRTAPADIVLPDARVSRSHCLIELADDRLKVSDLNSTNGTFIDGERIEGTGMLEVGSVLRVGNVSFMHAVRVRSDD